MKMILILFLSINTVLAKDFFEHFPQQITRLEDGTEIPTPTHFYDADIYMLIGAANAQGVASLIKERGYRPLKIGNQAVVILSFMFIHRHTLGPHNDFSVMIPITNGEEVKYQDEPFSILSQQAVNYISFDDYPPSIKADNELWKLDKRAGTLSRTKSGRNINFSLNVAGEELISAKFKDRLINPPLPATIKTLIPSASGVSIIYFTGRLKFAAFNPIFESLSIKNANHPLKFLNEFGFKPLMWQYAKGVKGAFTVPMRP